jgi:hypothetical protein
LRNFERYSILTRGINNDRSVVLPYSRTLRENTAVITTLKRLVDWHKKIHFHGISDNGRLVLDHKLRLVLLLRRDMQAHGARENLVDGFSLPNFVIEIVALDTFELAFVVKALRL